MKILFVCLGNICRSATADEVMRTLLRKEGLDKDYRLTHLSRPVCTDDFYNFDLILGMDDRNIANLRDMSPDIETEKKIGRMTDYCRTKVVDYVPDPYYGGAQGFENVLDILEDACQGLLEEIKKKLI